MLGAGLGRKESWLLTYNSRPQPHLCAARADGPAPQHKRYDITSKTSSTTPGFFDPRVRSTPAPADGSPGTADSSSHYRGKSD
jgi:hypothetical protein